MSLDELILKCKQQDRKAQEQLYNFLGARLFSVCLKYSRNKEEAEDNLQDSFVTIFHKINQFNHKGSFDKQRRITCSNSGGHSGLSSLGGVGGSD